jgi:hypothetical protein
MLNPWRKSKDSTSLRPKSVDICLIVLDVIFPLKSGDIYIYYEVDISGNFYKNIDFIVKELDL